MNYVTWIAVGWLALQTGVHAASFDCTKAQSQIEKLICGTPELSQLDEQVGAAYRNAIENRSKESSIRRSQRIWLTHRNRCTEVTCLKRKYLDRLSELAPQNQKYLDVSQIEIDGHETEATRLELVRNLVALELEPRPAQTNNQYRQKRTTAPTCDVLLENLLAGEFTAIEPIQIRTREDWPDTDRGDSPKRLADALNGFPAEFTNKLRFCASEEGRSKYQGLESALFLGFNSEGGAPPYRIYRLTEGVNPYRDSHFLYWANYSDSDGHGSPYVWINLEKCSPVFGVNAKSFDFLRDERPRRRAQAIALYRGKFSYLEVFKGMGFSIQHIEPGSVYPDSKDRLATYCHWDTFLR